MERHTAHRHKRDENMQGEERRADRQTPYTRTRTTLAYTVHTETRITQHIHFAKLFGAQFEVFWGRRVNDNEIPIFHFILPL